MSGGGKIITEGACVLTSFGKVMKATNRSPEEREESDKDFSCTCNKF